MARKVVRVQRDARLDEKEVARLQSLRARIAEDLPEIKQRAREMLREMRAVAAVCEALRAARQRQGLTLGDMERLTGIDRSALSKLERGERPNVTFETLARYATALGKRLRLDLEDAA
jgi:DNA-binding Xre family transcriptional regulator